MISKGKRYFRGEALFAASNSAQGFKSYYGDIFCGGRGLSRIYIIKGGPGTGKSRFMREVAEYAEGLSKYVEYYNCSSDPDSLDGIIIEDSIAIIDGTAPHVADAEIPGARDEIINLGSFWNGEKLLERYSEIKTLHEYKNDCFTKGYRYLSGCGELSALNRALIEPTIMRDKMRAYAERLISIFPRGSGFVAIPAISDSVGMRGRVKFDTYEKCAEKLYTVIDWYGSAHFFLGELVELSAERDIPLRISYDPINPDRVDSVYFCNSGTAFVASEPTELDENLPNRINMKRFIDRARIDSVKKEYRYNKRLYEALLSSACEAFARAGEYHFKLEEIYVSCMDFEAKERYTRSFCSSLGKALSNI